ncbi:MAG: hypothetical protein V2A77_10960 [Pseudomonadota bacterium]
MATEMEYLDTIIAKAQGAREDLDKVAQRSVVVLNTVRIAMKEAIGEFGLDGLAAQVEAKTDAYVGDLRAGLAVRERYGPALDAGALKIAEASVTAEVEIEFATAGGRSNAEQRRAEVDKRLSTDPEYQQAKGAREEAKRQIDAAEMETTIAEHEWKAALALYNGRVALVGAIGSIG